MSNPNKTVSCGPNGIRVFYTDTNRRNWIPYDEAEKTDSSVASKKIQTGRLISRLPQEESVNLSPKQVKLYRLALYGVEALNENERKNVEGENSFTQKLSSMRKESISRQQGRTQRLINRWKQEIVSDLVDGFLLKFFPKTKITEYFTSSSEYRNDKDVNPLSFKELGIGQKALIDKLISWGSLPQNFYEIR